MSELITPELVLLDQNLGETKFDASASLRTPSSMPHVPPTTISCTPLQKPASPRPTPASRAASPSPTAEARRSPNPPSRWHDPNPGVSFGAKDGPADLIFFIAAPDGADQEHLKLLSTLARSLMKKSFTASLREAQPPKKS